MVFPAYDMVPTAVTEAMTDALGIRPLEAYIARDLVCVLPDEESYGTFSRT